MRLPLHAATEVACVAGELWLTVDGDPADDVLAVGEAAIVQDLRPPHVVVALADSVMSLATVPSLPCTREPWGRRAPRWMRSWIQRRLDDAALRTSAPPLDGHPPRQRP